MPIGQNKTYTCIFPEDMQGDPTWLFERIDANDVAKAEPRNSEYRQKAIFVPKMEPNDTISTLTITGTASNNNTNISCHQTVGDVLNSRVVGSTEWFIFQIYGKSLVWHCITTTFQLIFVIFA